MSADGRRVVAEKIDLIESTTGKLFFEHKTELVFCQPHLIPLKTLAFERLEAMQRDTVRQLQQKRLQKKANAAPNEEAAGAAVVHDIS